MIVRTVLNGAWLGGRLLLGALLAGAAFAPAPLHAQPKQRIIRLEIQTSLGTIAVEVDSARAPRTAANFLRYVDAGHFKDSRFHRTVTLQNQKTPGENRSDPGLRGAGAGEGLLSAN